MLKIRYFKNRFCLLVVVIVVFWIEWISYRLRASTWVTLPNVNPDTSVRILLVSDAQILGENDMGFPLGYITRWDADWYLSKTFRLAKNYFKPDIIVFLGDNTDEGSIATDKQFEEYANRFFNIFVYEDVKQYVFIPGDNDIGGEGLDEITDKKMLRFRLKFKENQHVEYKFIQFIRANFFTHVIENVHNSTLKRILVSHFPVIPTYQFYGKQVIMKTVPDLIFSGHDHFSYHYMGKRPSGSYIATEIMEDSSRLWKYNLNKGILHEFMVPTCSYRMGREVMGYGAAILEESGTLYYTVLWLPGRYPQLYCYVILLTFLLIYTIFKFRLYSIFVM